MILHVHGQSSLTGMERLWNSGTISVSPNLRLWKFRGRPSKLVVVQLPSRVWFFVTPWTAACQAFLSSAISQSLLKLMSIDSVMPSNHLIPFSSCLQTFPASRSFAMSQIFTSDSHSIGASASASVFPVNIQDWFPLGFPLGFLSLQPKGLSSTTVHKGQFFSAQPALCSNSHICTWLLEKS